MKRLAPLSAVGPWAAYELADAGFYLSLESEGAIELRDGDTSRVMSADAASIVVCLRAFKFICDSSQEDMHIETYCGLSKYAKRHAEVSQIRAMLGTEVR